MREDFGEPVRTPQDGALVGRVLGGRYRVGELLGAGAMGCVYAAEHLELGRACAVKVIRVVDDDDRDGPRRAHLVARFYTEGLAGARMDHVNVLRVLDFGHEHADDLHFLVTEHLDGVDLVDLMARERLDVARAVGIVRQMCSALQHAHDQGVVHRDIKPENVRLVRRDGDDGEATEVVKLLDFGTALIAGREEPGERIVIGTPAYMAPEQATAEGADARSDVYALGVVLFELLTGRLPFERSSAIALAAAHVECMPPSPSDIDPRIGPELDALILSCLSKSPIGRPQSARELRDALDAIPIEGARTPRSTTPSLLPLAPVAMRADARTTVMRPRGPRLGRGSLGVAAALVATAAAITMRIASPVGSGAEAAVTPLPASPAAPSAALAPVAAAPRPSAIVARTSASAAPTSTPTPNEPGAVPEPRSLIAAATTARRTVNRPPPSYAAASRASDPYAIGPGDPPANRGGDPYASHAGDPYELSPIGAATAAAEGNGGAQPAARAATPANDAPAAPAPRPDAPGTYAPEGI